MHQFCVGAAKGVLSPFVLQEIVMETLQRLNPIHAHNHLRAPAFHQLVQRCQQAYMQYIHHRLIHLTPADYDDFVNAIRSARSAFCLTPMGMMQFNDILQNLKRSKQTKELWQRVSLEITTFSPESGPWRALFRDTGLWLWGALTQRVRRLLAGQIIPTQFPCSPDWQLLLGCSLGPRCLRP